MKHLFRYKKSDCFLVFSFVTAFVCLCCAFVCKGKTNTYEADAEKYGYKNEIEIRVSQTDSFSLASLLDGIEGIAYIVDWPVSLSDEAVLCTAKIVCHTSDSDEIKVALRGKNILKDMPTSQQAIIGIKTSEMCNITSNSTYIDGEEYSIVGVMGSKKSEYDHYGVILWMDALGKTTKERIQNAEELTILVGSDSVNGDMLFRRVKDNIEKSSLPCSVQIDNIVELNENEENAQKVRFYMLLYAFALVNCIVSMELWLYERSSELAIRLTLGANRRELFIHCFIEAINLAVFSLLISSLLIMLCSYIFKINVKGAFSILDILIFVGTVLLTAFVSILLKITTVVKSDTPIEAMKAGGEL